MNEIPIESILQCELCGKKFAKTMIDGQTIFGAFAFMCPSCFTVFGEKTGNNIYYERHLKNKVWITSCIGEDGKEKR
jgi:ribosome-binding protein aMBF1 (putative translation factor)